jgi:uncharacterized protein YbjT (DUF2867 family)
MKTVLVTGASGALGREVVARLQENRFDVRALSRSPRTGEGWVQGHFSTVDLDGIDTIVHCASDPRHPNQVDVQGTAQMLKRAAAAGVGHIVYPSIVGIDRIPFPYYRAKLATERLIAGSGVPYTILRTTQYHGFLDQLLGFVARMPWMPLPSGFRAQPMDVRDAAIRMLWCVDEGPEGRIPDVAGPEILSLHRIAEEWLQARGMKRCIVNVPLPGQTARAFRFGWNTLPNRVFGGRSWTEWLRERYA